MCVITDVITYCLHSSNVCDAPWKCTQTFSMTLNTASLMPTRSPDCYFLRSRSQLFMIEWASQMTLQLTSMSAAFSNCPRKMLHEVNIYPW